MKTNIDMLCLCFEGNQLNLYVLHVQTALQALQNKKQDKVLHSYQMPNRFHSKLH